ncbi:hypothetical protein [Gulosibacter hominis]|uniref:hypothetical protein n=1 Tax=Gulosibacter hominis TaxID=2770504 RepID=UPI00191B5DB8|nr:hypothetical protein [Gulosibacter hominis]
MTRTNHARRHAHTAAALVTGILTMAFWLTTTATAAHAATESPEPSGPTVVDLPATFGLTAQSFYIIGAILLIGALALVVVLARRGNRR